MGTSISFRSPRTPRWQALNAAYEAQLPLEHMRALVFAAGETDWAPALGDPALATFVDALAAAHEEMPARFGQSDRPDSVILECVRDARRALETDGFTPAISIAERALRAVLIGVTQGDSSLDELDSKTAAEQWVANRGQDAAALVHSFLGELLSQYTRHVVARDLPRLLGTGAMSNVEDLRSSSQALAAEAQSVGRSFELPSRDVEVLAAQWSELVAAAFARGKRSLALVDA